MSSVISEFMSSVILLKLNSYRWHDVIPYRTCISSKYLCITHLIFNRMRGSMLVQNSIDYYTTRDLYDFGNMGIFAGNMSTYPYYLH